MNKSYYLISLFLAICISFVQAGGVLAAPESQAGPPIRGILQKITLETDSSTAVTTVVVEIRKGNEVQTVRISQETALRLGIIGLDGDGRAVINEKILGKHVEVDQTDLLQPDEEKHHPVADALARFFFSSLGAEDDQMYDAIMEARDQGIGFGVIAQILWLTQEIPGGGDLEDFQTLLNAKQTGIYADVPFVDENGATITPKNWGELRNAILSGKPVMNLGAVISNKEGNDPVNDPNTDHENNRDKDKTNSGNGPNNEKEKEKKK